jgi:hypothetical protein
MFTQKGEQTSWFEATQGRLLTPKVKIGSLA